MKLYNKRQKIKLLFSEAWLLAAFIKITDIGLLNEAFFCQWISSFSSQNRSEWFVWIDWQGSWVQLTVFKPEVSELYIHGPHLLSLNDENDDRIYKCGRDRLRWFAHIEMNYKTCFHLHS